MFYYKTPLCSQNINKQIVNIADKNLTDYRFLSRYHYTKSKNYLKRQYRIRHWIPMFTGTPCIKRVPWWIGNSLNERLLKSNWRLYQNFRKWNIINLCSKKCALQKVNIFEENGLKNPWLRLRLVIFRTFSGFKVLMQGKLIVVAFTLRTYWNQFSLGGICKQE